MPAGGLEKVLYRDVVNYNIPVFHFLGVFNGIGYIVTGIV
jgi:hypothetical protein